MSTPPIELFRCVPLAARISRRQCAGLWTDGQAAQRPGSMDRLRTSHCRGCSVGEAHARGEAATTWADGSPVELAVPGVAPTVLAHRVSLPVIGSQEENHVDPKTYTHNGITDTVEGWAKRLGCTGNALRIRLKKGWPVERAFATKGEIANEASRPAPSARAQRLSQPSTVIAVREAIAQVPLRALLERLGYDVTDAARILSELGIAAQDLGTHPRGRLLLLEGA